MTDYNTLIRNAKDLREPGNIKRVFEDTEVIQEIIPKVVPENADSCLEKISDIIDSMYRDVKNTLDYEAERPNDDGTYSFSIEHEDIKDVYTFFQEVIRYIKHSRTQYSKQVMDNLEHHLCNLWDVRDDYVEGKEENYRGEDVF